MKYPAYPKYKESGIEWLGDVPEHWEVKRIKHLGTIRYGLSEPPEYLDEGLPFIRATDTNQGKIDLEKVKRVSPDDVPWNKKPRLALDEILVVRSGAYTGDSAIVTSAVSGCIVGYDMVLTVNKRHAQFVAWVLLSKYMLQGQIYLERLRAAQPHLNAEELGGFSIFVPPLLEQHAIGDFLDRETTKLDTLLAKKRALIVKLKEKRTALISRTVTRGLPPEAACAAGLDHHPKFKPSGMDWVGEVPVRWELLPFTKYVAEKSDYRGRTPEKVPDGVFLVTAKNVRMGYIDYESSKEYVAEDEYDEIMRRGLPKKGDILFTTEAPLGNVALVDREDVALAQRIIRFRMDSKHFHSGFTLHAMMSDHFQVQLRSLSTGSTAEGLKASKLPILRIVAAPLPEQEVIADYLDRETAKIDRLIEKVQAAIEKLQEYRIALITDAVTGKIDVRGLTLQEGAT